MGFHMESVQVQEEKEGVPKEVCKLDDREEMEIDKEEGNGKAYGLRDTEEEMEVKDRRSSKRWSRRTCSRPAKEKIEKLKEDSSEWEEEEKRRKGPKRKRKGVKSENKCGETVVEEKNGKEESHKRTRRRKSLKNEEDNNKVGFNQTGEGRCDNAAKSKRGKKLDENGKDIERTTCHQCKRNDKGRVVRCTKCTTKRYCVPCMKRW